MGPTKKKSTKTNGQEKRKDNRRKTDGDIIKLQEIVLGMHGKILELEKRLELQSTIVYKAKDRLGL
jgi:hypothetical protein